MYGLNETHGNWRNRKLSAFVYCEFVVHLYKHLRVDSFIVLLLLLTISAITGLRNKERRPSKTLSASLSIYVLLTIVFCPLGKEIFASIIILKYVQAKY